MYFIIVCVLILLIYLYGTRNHKYWTKRGVKHDKPLPIFGNYFMNILLKRTDTQLSVELYNKYKNEKFVGYYVADRPTLVVMDPDIVKAILMTDFTFFHHRGVRMHDEVIEPMLKNLFYADGDLWKLSRQRLTPAFTSGKLKAMFPLIVERAEKVQILAEQASKTGETVDVRDLIARYTTDFIGACGFGVDTNSLNDENSDFRKLGKRIFDVTLMDAIKYNLKLMFPDAFKNIDVTANEITQTTLHLVQSVMKQRNYKPSGRNDFIDLLMNLKEQGKLRGDSIEHKNPDGTTKIVEIELDDMLLAAQVFIFFAAGFETSSSSSSYTLHQLAFYPEKQNKVQKEIDEVLSKYDNKLCYDAIKEMKYLEMAFLEGMRLFPSLGVLNRKCVKKYTLLGTDVTIDEGVNIIIPVQAMHLDEKYFEDPEKYIPERFSPDRINRINKHVYLPFGEGPRACIGERLGLMQSLTGLAALLQKFTVEPAPTSLKKPIVDPTGIVVQNIKGGIPLKIKSRK